MNMVTIGRVAEAGKGERGMKGSGKLVAEQKRYVLDAYALLSYLDDGPGAERLRELMDQGRSHEVVLATSMINLGEALSVVERVRGLHNAQTALARLSDLPVRRYDASEDLTLLAAHYNSLRPVPYSDCFAIALARKLNGTLVTGNTAMQPAADLVKIEWL